MSDPDITVVLPVFNAQAHLGPLLASLRSQTAASFEIVAVDDGSSDASLSMLRAAAAQDQRFIVLSQRNRGVSAARNLALTHARGRWIAFADADDWLDPRLLETWRDHGDRAGLDLVLGNGFRFIGTPTPPGLSPAQSLVTSPMAQPIFSGTDWIKRCIARRQWPHFVWLQLVSRRMILAGELRFVEGIVHEDVLWTLRLGLLARRVGFSAEPLYGYRNHAESLTRSDALSALQHRAWSYLIVMRQFALAAKEHRHDFSLWRALLVHTQREGRNLFTLMGEGVLGSATRRRLARKFLRLELLRTMFLGAENLLTLVRAVRFWLLLRHCTLAMFRPGTADHRARRQPRGRRRKRS
ncbi:MAG: glycosyltransferase [Pseudomonadota bacterium]|nr:glycosyltransferase [Pseudomonadota bacterium]